MTTQKETLNLLIERLKAVEELVDLLTNEREENIRIKKDREKQKTHHDEWRVSFRREANRIGHEDAKAKREKRLKRHHPDNIWK